MAGKKVWLQTNGLVDQFDYEGVLVTRDGVEVESEAKAKAIEERAATLGVHLVRMEQAPEVASTTEEGSQ